MWLCASHKRIVIEHMSIAGLWIRWPQSDVTLKWASVCCGDQSMNCASETEWIAVHSIKGVFAIVFWTKISWLPQTNSTAEEVRTVYCITGGDYARTRPHQGDNTTCTGNANIIMRGKKVLVYALAKGTLCLGKMCSCTPSMVISSQSICRNWLGREGVN